jgi:DNA-binding NarL/FixJ family response regulator
MKVLIADDHDLILKPLEELICSFGEEFETASVGSVDAAVARLSKEHFDFVLSDLYFPGNSAPSFSVIDAATERGISSAVLSAEISPELLELAFRAGALSYIPKALKLHALASLIEVTVIYGVSTAPLLFKQSASILERVEAMSNGAKKTIKLLCENPGSDHKTLARLAGQSPNTVKSYMSQWMRLFSVSSSAAAAEEFKKVYGINGG